MGVRDWPFGRIVETFKSMHIASPKVVNQSMDVFLTICSEHKINCMDYVELVQLTTLKHHPPFIVPESCR